MKRICQAMCFCIVLFFTHMALGASIGSIVSIPPVKFFVKQIAAQGADVDVLIPPGANPITFEPKPRQIQKIRQAQIYFAIGVPFEKVWIKRIKAINESLKIIRLYRGVVRVPMAHRYNELYGSRVKISQDFPDPHIWLSPSLVRVILQEIRDTFISYDKSHKQIYLANYYNFLKKINSMDQELIDMFSRCKSRYFLVFHPSWGYFARDYGIIQVPIELEGKEPSLTEISKLISFARSHKIKVVFVEPEFSKRISMIIAQSINAKVEEIDPLAVNWLDNLKIVAQRISNSLR